MSIRRTSWGWENAMVMMLRHMLRHQDRAAPEDITPEMLRRLWQHQNGQCALSGVTLVLPESNVLENHTSLNSWRERVLARGDRRAYDHSPDLVRANNNLPWALGNIILIAHMYYQLYTVVGTISGFKTLCGSLATRKVNVAQSDHLVTETTEDKKEENNVSIYDSV